MNNAYASGFIKAAYAQGLSANQLLSLIKSAGSGMLPALMGAVPGAAVGGYMAHDRAIERKKEDPQYTGNPNHAGILGSLLGAGAGGMIGAGAGGVGHDRGVQDESERNAALMHMLTNRYMGA